MSDEIKSGYAKLPNWLQDFVKQKKITGFDAYLWAVLNNTTPDYRYRVATLVNQGYPIDQVKLSIKRLSTQKLIKEIRIHGRWVEWETVDFEKEWWKIHQSLVENPPIVSGKSTTNKNTHKNINNGENSPGENTPPAPIRGSLNIDHLFVRGKRRERLEDSLERILGEFVPEFIPWLEKRCMTNKAMLPLRLDQKLHQTTLANAKLFLSLRAMEKEYEKY